jgi:hypothetical protein
MEENYIHNFLKRVAYCPTKSKITCIPKQANERMKLDKTSKQKPLSQNNGTSSKTAGVVWP